MLTDEIREFIRSYPPTSLLFDFVADLRIRFGLTPTEAGRVLADWIRETC